VVCLDERSGFILLSEGCLGIDELVPFFEEEGDSSFWEERLRRAHGYSPLIINKLLN
jgi:hypothetical protein